MNIIQAVILGIVEGITEFLPVSSTGHLILTTNLLNINPTEFVKSFEVAIQVGAICAVIVLYRKDLFRLEMIKKLAVAFIPTAIVGLVFYPFIKEQLLESNSVVLWSLFLGGLFLILFEYHFNERENSVAEVQSISYKQSLVIGSFQAIAVIPGVSRAAATIIGGLVSGIKRRAIVEFSFLLAVPTMIAATGLDLTRSYKDFESGSFGVLAVGFITAFIVAMAAIKYFLRFIQRHDFKPFGIYRIVIALVFWWFLM